ncbi:MAG: hypothetical protein DMF60_07525 [Acidobacteria bacterium]|nr:MAG: hypothetical protein DMF60_07525 [Acidobacteriota bacterium]
MFEAAPVRILLVAVLDELQKNHTRFSADGNYRGIELRSRDLPACSSGTFYYAPNTSSGKTVQTRKSDNHR